MAELKPSDIRHYDGEPYFTVGGASRAIGASIKTVRKLMDEGVLQGVQAVPNQNRVIPYDNVMDYLKARIAKQSKRGTSLKDKPPKHPKKVYYQFKGVIPPPAKSKPPDVPFGN